MPHGWKKVGKKRKSGNWDFYVFGPNGKRFRSNNELSVYLNDNPHIKCDRDVTNTNRVEETLGEKSMETVAAKMSSLLNVCSDRKLHVNDSEK